MRSPYEVIIKPHITERTVVLSYGDPRIKNEADLTRKYTFIVATDSNKLEIKAAFEAIYNAGKKDSEKLIVANVQTIKVLGKNRRRGRMTGRTPDRKKAIITLAKGQMLEEYGV